MKHPKAVKVLVIVAASVVVVFIVGLRLVDVIAKSVIDDQVTEILGVEARFSGVKLGILSSSSSFTGVTIRNPPGFKEDYVLTIERADIDVGIGTLMSNDIEIPNVVLTGMDFDLEEIDKKINIEEIIKHIQTYCAAQPKTDTPTQLEIKELHVKDLKLNATGEIVTIAGGHLETKVPDFTVKNVGTKADTGEMTSQFVNILTHTVLAHVFDHPIDGFSSVASASIHKAAHELPMLPVNFLKSGFDKLGDAIDDLKSGGSSKPDEPDAP